MIINRNYTRLLFASFITRFGDSVDGIAFSWLVYVQTGSRVLMGSIFALSVLPNLIILPFSGVLADTCNKKHLVVLSDFLRGIFVLLLGLLYITDLLAVWHLFAFVFINNVFESFASPARTSLLPSVITEEDYVKGSSYLSSARSFGTLLGLGVAGLVIGLFGIGTALFIDAATFTISAFTILRITYHYIPESTTQTVQDFFIKIKEGFVFLKGKRLLVSLLFLWAFVNFAFSPINILQPIYVETVMNVGVEGLTYLGIALSLGMTTCGILMGKIGHKINPLNAIGFGLGMMGLMYFLLGYIDYLDIPNWINIPSIILFAFLFAFFIPVMQAPVQAVILKKIPKELLGRMMSTIALFTLSSMPLGGILVSVVGDSISVPLFFIYMGLLISFVGSLYWLSNRRNQF